MALPTDTNTDGPAVVVGLCAHGLAVARALARSGVRVLALEANPSLPGVLTRYASVTRVAAVNGPPLIATLNDFAQSLPPGTRPVLFLTNDNMVRNVGERWDELAGRYRLSWSECRDGVLRLLDKSSLEAHCDALGLPYPKSRMLTAADELDALADAGALAFPMIVKPTRPLSGFKVRLVEDAAGLRKLVADHGQALPFLLQQWIPGGDEQLFFTAFYLERGRILACYEGQKLGSNPPAMGQTTIARSRPNPAARAIAERFFAPLGLSGPVSLEVKLDAAGQPWIIEPTLGRTDYWLDCCVANGVNLPALEYAHQTGNALPEVRQRDDAIWFDTERTPFSYLRFRLGAGRRLDHPWRARFPYFGHSDGGPYLRGLRRFVTHSASRVWRRVTR